MTMPQVMCANCGKPLSPVWRDKCHHCGAPMHIARRLAEWTAAPETLVRTYRGNQPSAAYAFQQDARQLCQQGYAPGGQTWAPGQWGGGAYLIALVAILIFGIGLLILGYLLIVKPDGTLTVTYRRQVPLAAATPNPLAAASAAPQPDTTPSGRLAQLEATRGAGLVTDEEYAAKRAQILTAH